MSVNGDNFNIVSRSFYFEGQFEDNVKENLSDVFLPTALVLLRVHNFKLVYLKDFRKKEARIFNKQSWTGVERVAREIEEHVA